MKILIAPLIIRAKADANYQITRTLSDLFSFNQHAVAISTSRANSISTAALYDAAELQKTRFFKKDQYCYEEWMYGVGASRREYLEDDLEYIGAAIDQFKPDLIISLDRIAAVIMARKKNIPCVCIVNTSVYRTATFPVKLLQELNKVLSFENMEQVFRISDLYDYCDERIVFGPIQIQPMPLDAQFQRFGTFVYQKDIAAEPKSVYITLPSVEKKPAALRKMIIDTFSGASYPVHAFIPGVPSEKIQNIHFLAMQRDELMREAAVCIHDGNDYACNACAASAVVQLIVTDHYYGRIANALAARRYGFGIMSDEDELSVAELYENYRRLVSAARYKESALKIRDEIISLGDFGDFHRFIVNRFRR